MNSPEADSLGVVDLETLETSRPGLLAAVQKFYRVYKVPAGEGENKFAFNGEVRGQQFAGEVIR